MQTTPRVILAIAAEVNDDSIWTQLQTLQAQMFPVGPVNIKLGYFAREDAANEVRPYVSTRWVDNADDMLDLIDRARDHCVCGCFVTVGDILEHALQEARDEAIQAIVIIGDRFHGELANVIACAKQLRALGTRLFVFQQGIGADTECAFKRLTEATDGAFFQFNPHVERIAQRLPRVLEAIAHYAIGGLPALEAQDNEAASLLIEQMNADKQIAH